MKYATIWLVLNRKRSSPAQLSFPQISQIQNPRINMATQLCINSPFTLNSPISYCRSPVKIHQFQPLFRYTNNSDSRNSNTLISIRCSSAKPTEALRTCKNCKAQFDPSLNDPRSCRYHTAHFGGIKFSFC